MRANEFVIEGPGDWMQKQVIGRKQKDQAKARKQNIPKITKLLQQNLAVKADQLIKKAGNNTINLKGAILKMVANTIKKSVENADKHEINSLAQVVASDIENIATSEQISKLIGNIVTKSFFDPDAEAAEKAAASEEPGPGTKKRLQKFDAEVFYPQGIYDRNAEGDQLVYVNREGKWSLFRMADRHQWEFVNAVDNEEEQAAIERLIGQQNLQPIPQTFKYKKQDYYWVN